MAKSKEPTTQSEPTDKTTETVDVKKALDVFDPKNIPTVTPEVIKMTDIELAQIFNSLSGTFGVSVITIVNAVVELIRLGGANKNTPLSFSITIQCPDQRVTTHIQKRDVVRAIEICCPEKNFRNLADTLAVDIIKAGIARTKKFPNKDFGGDLAKKISTRLAFQNKPALTPEERVGCASYAQHIPNLDELVGSDRLRSLLAEDLELRKASNERKSATQSKKKFSSKERKNTLKKDEKTSNNKSKKKK